jgi:germination protein M
VMLSLASILACDIGIGSRGPVMSPLPRTEAPPGGSILPTASPTAASSLTPAVPSASAPPLGPSQPPATSSPDVPTTSAPLPPGTPAPADPTPTPRPQPTPTATPAVGSTDVTVYLLMDSGAGPTLVPAVRTLRGRPAAIATATMQDLLAGPDRDERSADPSLATAIPDGTRLLGLSIDGGIATIDLSREFESGGASAQMARLAQVVFTLTQFRTVDQVRFELDGQPVSVPTSERGTVDSPVGREDYVSVLPPIFVDSPAWGGRFGGSARGMANVFEATLFVELADAGGSVLDSRRVMATCGTGCWGGFEVDLSRAIDEAGRGTLSVFSRSAMDGSVQDLRRYPVRLRPAG